MIVDFAEIKSRLNSVIDMKLRAEIKSRAPFLASLNSSKIHEGDKNYYETVEHSKKELKLQTASSNFSITNEEIKSLKFPDILERIKKVAESMAGQMEGGILMDTFKSLEESGNTIPGNPKISGSAILKGLEIMQVDFIDDDRTKPNNLTLVLHPDAARQLKEEEQAMTAEEKEEFEKKRNAILDKKYEEYIKREGHRKLVD